MLVHLRITPALLFRKSHIENQSLLLKFESSVPIYISFKLKNNHPLTLEYQKPVAILTEARDLLEIIHARHKRASTIFCSQFTPAGWYGKFPDATIADAIPDRIVHDSYTIEIRGADEHSQKSMREVYGVGSK